MSGNNSNPSNAPMIPMKNLIGFILSLVLTFVALWLGLSGALSFAAVIVIILILACLQIAVQLYFFMHFTESDGPLYHVIALSLGLFFAICVIGGTIWIMTFNSQVS